MNAFFWLLVGAFIGFDIGLGYAWLSARRLRLRMASRRADP